VAISSEYSLLDDAYHIVQFHRGAIVLKTATRETFVIQVNEFTLTKPILTSKGVALGGSVTITVRRDGTVSLQGKRA